MAKRNTGIDDMVAEAEIYDEDVDNARDLTSGLVVTTSVLLLFAVITVFVALNSYFGVGPFSG